jgi:hypothetical protein
MQVKTVLILIGNRKVSADKVQKVLTGWGCHIKTRLGLHPGVLDDCTEQGLIFLEVVGEKDKLEELVRKLNSISHVQAKYIELEADE